MCVFCDIINHKIPSKVVYEDDDVLAIWDISQVTKGHTLVMPKKHYANILEVDENTLQHCTSVVHKLAKQIVENTGAKGCNVLSNCGEIAGQSVDHLHFHIIPRYSSKDSIEIKFNPSPALDLDEVLQQVKG